jgi:hypothetical protein
VNDDADRKIVLAGEEAKAVLAKFAATNRVPWSGPMFLKLFFAGNISFDATTGPRGWGIGYIPHHDAASYGQYYFRLKGTNDLRSVFEWWRTNDVRGTH